ncbi:hypothetical protein KR032_004355 [Drosophila birchii]|nr:hypothetical protein KR032_004355 [Drosophila birchii]
MAQSAVDVALKKFIATTDRISQFEANINTPGAPETECSQYMLAVHRDQIRALWEKVEKTYESSSDLLAVSDDNTATVTPSIRGVLPSFGTKLPLSPLRLPPTFSCPCRQAAGYRQWIPKSLRVIIFGGPPSETCSRPFTSRTRGSPR